MNTQQSFQKQTFQSTPPESLTSPPLTPPASVEKAALTASAAIPYIIEEIRRRKYGHPLPSEEPWLRFILDAHQYRDLQQQLRNSSLWGFVEDKLRYDYFPSSQLFVLRMATLLHESLISDTTRGIMRQLDTIAEGNGPSAEFARGIRNKGSARIRFPEHAEYGPHHPDSSFKHIHAQYPGVVIEVSYTQKRKDLAHLADDYILGSDRDIRVVIGIDIEYRASKAATLSVWRPQIMLNEAGERELCVVQTLSDQPFRDDKGRMVLDPEAGLHLRLEDFGTEAFAATFDNLREPIYISAQTLYTSLEEAEAEASRDQLRQGLACPSKPWVRKRKRELTPEEQLSAERESTFIKEEQKATEKANDDDSSYEGSSSSGAEAK